MTTDDGGQAFPVPGHYAGYEQEEAGRNGMSLREWFAGMAMQGLWSNPGCDYSHEEAAETAYKQADAMLAESRREREPDGGSD